MGKYRFCQRAIIPKSIILPKRARSVVLDA